MLSSDDRAGIRARIENCRTYNFGMRDADRLAHEDAGALLVALEAAEAEVKRLQFAIDAASPTVDDLAKAYDPEAFEDHPIEARSSIAAIQWAARRKMASAAAVRAVPLIGADIANRMDRVRAQRDELFELRDQYLDRAEAAEAKLVAAEQRWLASIAPIGATLHDSETRYCGNCWKCLDAISCAPIGYVLCGTCGNKRCSHAADHELECRGSNAPGQPGATRYPAPGTVSGVE